MTDVTSARVALFASMIAVAACSSPEPAQPPEGGSSSGGAPPDGGSVDAGAASTGDAAADGGAPTAAVAFTGTELDLPNPERGFFSFSGELSGASASTFTSLYGKGERISYASANLSAFRGSALSSAYLDGLTTGFASARQAGMKVVLRFLYDDTESGQDAPLGVVLQHIGQLAPILAANADVIAILQGGFIGAWGEWHSSSNGLTTPANRAAVRDALLDALPDGVFLDLRYPPDLMGWYPTVLNEARAFQSTPQARIGVHNDCFMASATDVGTYSSNPQTQALQRDYVKALSALTPFGGETCAGDAKRTACADILAEGRDYHVAYLNRTYDTSFHDAWIAGGCFDEVSRSLGYRIQLDALSYPPTAKRGGSTTLRAELRNVGWARIFSARKLTAVLRHEATGALLVSQSAGDVRLPLAPSATTSTRIEIPIAIPADAAPGGYEISLALPDVWPSTERDPRFAVRFANADDPAKGQAWDAATARFQTGATLTIE